ncbi:MAG: hypothetical protein ACREU3_03740 [Steroidobacteraceae bacterium]
MSIVNVSNASPELPASASTAVTTLATFIDSADQPGIDAQPAAQALAELLARNR